MNTDTSAPPSTELDEPEVAFQAMARKLAGLTAAIEGFAARQQELHARDYGPDLVKIRERQEKFRVAIESLSQRPAMALTPQIIASQIELAGEQGRAADHQAWSSAHRELGYAIQSIKGVVASAVAARTQKLWITGAAVAAMVVGFILGAIIPAKIDQAVPERWYWPEARAAEILQRDGWDAGMRLLQVSDSRRWQMLNEAARISRENAKVLATCRSRAARMKKATQCMINVGLEG